MWSDITFGMMLVSLGMLCVAQGFQAASQYRALKIQAQLLKAQAELEAEVQRLRFGQVDGGMTAIASWRQLPPEARQQLRHALATVLAEIDADGAVRH